LGLLLLLLLLDVLLLQLFMCNADRFLLLLLLLRCCQVRRVDDVRVPVAGHVVVRENYAACKRLL
jgi:hypothetical protein